MRKPGFYKATYRGLPAIGYCLIENDGSIDYEWWTVLFETSLVSNQPPSVAQASFGLHRRGYAEFEVMEPITFDNTVS